MKTGSLLILFLLSTTCQAQGDLSYLKNLEYLRIYRAQPFNCDSLSNAQVNTMTDRICANLQLQRSDSILKVEYDRLLVEVERVGGDSLVTTFNDLQYAWRTFRDRHCKSVAPEITGNASATEWMNEMRRITDIRTAELRQLYSLYRND